MLNFQIIIKNKFIFNYFEYIFVKQKKNKELFKKLTIMKEELTFTKEEFTEFTELGYEFILVYSEMKASGGFDYNNLSEEQKERFSTLIDEDDDIDDLISDLSVVFLKIYTANLLHNEDFKDYIQSFSDLVGLSYGEVYDSVIKEEEIGRTVVLGFFKKNGLKN